MKIDWKRKLTSRKFWAAIVGFVTPLLIAFGAQKETATEVAGIIMAGGTLIAYIIGEGMVDAGSNYIDVSQMIGEEADGEDDGNAEDRS